jgi:transcriptional regulator with XRE-family HTH domain
MTTTLSSDSSTRAGAIGEKLRHRRTVRRMSLKDVAEKANLSIGLLSQVERGLSVPSLRSLSQICAALEMPVRWLFEGEGREDNGESAVVVRKNSRRHLDFASMRKEILSPDAVSQIQLMRFVIYPGGSSAMSPNQHPTGAKAGIVIAGQLGLELEGREYVLTAGDSFSFLAASRYRFWCVGETECEVHWAVTPSLY